MDAAAALTLSGISGPQPRRAPSLGLAGEAARVRGDPGLEARHAHRLEALRALAGHGRRRSELRGVLARPLHRHVAVEADDVVRREAGRAALARQALDHEGRVAADVGAALHQPARLALVSALVEPRLRILLPDELRLDVR